MIVYSQSVHGKNSRGCRVNQRDVMITLSSEHMGEYKSYFLTNQQAVDLAKEITRVTNQNEPPVRLPWWKRFFKKWI